ncbi:hypothetical protein CDV55_104183 [Aspergillus turcosus]|nr:hypothetical protein CDV55_104183 [Aspergillus turcosus]
MTGNQFPLNEYITALAKFLETIDYQDENFTHEQRVKSLRYVYYHTAKHFDQPVEKAALKVSAKRLQAVMRTSTLVTVYCWAKCPLDVMVGVSVYFRMNAHLTNFLRYYGGFCGITIFRSTLDFFQGCWIEQNNFGGFPGSSYFPHFLRRLNGLGGISSATLFPSSEFDEELHFKEIVTAVAQIEPQLTLCNDLISFYKEFDSPRDQINLVSNLTHCNGVDWKVAFEQLTSDTIFYCEQLVNVFKGKDPKVEATVRAFVHGYVTWHLCDPRFRMEEVYRQAGQSEADMKFRRYYEEATRIGVIDFELWASQCDLKSDSMKGGLGQLQVMVSKMAGPIFLTALGILGLAGKFTR